MNGEIVTVFCAFTRRWAVDKWIEDFRSVPHDPALVNLVFIVDIDEPYIRLQLNELGKDYRSCHVEYNQYNQPNEVRVIARRHRIAEIKNLSKKFIAKTDGDYVIGLEDDTVFPNADLGKFITYLKDHQSVGFIQGVQCGRWGVKVIGAWEVYYDLNNPSLAETVRSKSGQDIQDKITAGGFYGYATRKHLYLGHEYYSASTQPYGPDVNYGIFVTNCGYDCMIDWSIVFGHNDHNVILYPDEQIARVRFEKNMTGEWIRMDVES